MICLSHDLFISCSSLILCDALSPFPLSSLLKKKYISSTSVDHSCNFE